MNRTPKASGRGDCVIAVFRMRSYHLLRFRQSDVGKPDTEGGMQMQVEILAQFATRKKNLARHL